MTALDDVLEDPEPVEDLLAAVQDAMAGYENPGFIVKEHDGAWYVSPLATLTEQLFAVVRALDRDEIEELQELPATPSRRSTVRRSRPMSRTPAASRRPIRPRTCYGESDATAAATCFQALLDAGTIEELDFPLFLQYPECGLAEISWSGEYYTLPDDEFIALVEETAPCFEALVESGELEDWELPLEMSASGVPRRSQLVRRHRRRRVLRLARRVRDSPSIDGLAVTAELPAVAASRRRISRRSLPAVRTRTLLLLAVGCGLAILVAGVVQLLRVAGQDDPPVAATVGEPVRVGDLTVTVVDYTEAGADGRGHDRDRAASTTPTAPTASSWSHPARRSRRAEAMPPACAGTTVAAQRCTLTYDLGDGAAGTSRVLLYRRGDEQVRWEMALP